ncbi:MAG: YeeE/YedE family protein [Gammaproteobacteria bacterium]|nr:YeeE/YedE family protein [Gammaproteobacteria bacterium]
MGLRESLQATAPYGLAWGGLALGVVFGALVEHTRFCAMGAVSDWHGFGDARRLRAWLLATAVALLGAQGLDAAGVVDLNLSMYLAPRLNWLGNVLGGLLFGIGMVFAGGCASRNLVRLGAGDLRAAVVLVTMGVFAYMSLGGLLGPLRSGLEQATALDLPGEMNASLVSLITLALPAPAGMVRVALILLLAGALLVYCLSDAAFRASPRLWVGGVGVGLCVCAAWALSGLAYDEFADVPLAPQGLSFVRPVGDSLEYLQRYTAAPVPDFGVATVLGTVLGAGLAAWRARRFKLVGFADSGDTLRNLAGAALMGIGGVVAMGCSIGQSVTGVSTLAAGSLLAAAALFAGGVLGLRMLERML